MANMFGAFFAPDDRILVVTAEGTEEDRIIEVLLPQAPRAAAITGMGSASKRLITACRYSTFSRIQWL